MIELAKNFSDRKLPVGVIVIDLGVPTTGDYYRLDPARFPEQAMPSANAISRCHRAIPYHARVATMLGWRPC